MGSISLSSLANGCSTVSVHRASLSSPAIMDSAAMLSGTCGAVLGLQVFVARELFASNLCCHL